MLEIWPSVLAFFDAEVELEATDGQRPLWYERVTTLYASYEAYCTRTGQDLICGPKLFKEQLGHLVKNAGGTDYKDSYRHPTGNKLSRVFVGIKHKSTAAGAFVGEKPNIAATCRNPKSIANANRALKRKAADSGPTTLGGDPHDSTSGAAVGVVGGGGLGMEHGGAERGQCLPPACSSSASSARVASTAFAGGAYYDTGGEAHDMGLRLGGGGRGHDLAWLAAHGGGAYDGSTSGIGAFDSMAGGREEGSGYDGERWDDEDEEEEEHEAWLRTL
jgi:hypothetical protein